MTIAMLMSNVIKAAKIRINNLEENFRLGTEQNVKYYINFTKRTVQNGKCKLKKRGKNGRRNNN